jgi:hypothetical protein
VVIVSPVRDLVEAVRQQRAGRMTFFGHDADAPLRLLTAARLDFVVGKRSTPLERIMANFRGVPQGPVCIETVTAEESSRFSERPDVARR